MEPKSENPLEDVLKNIISGISSKGGLTQEDVASAWESAVGQAAAKHSKTRALKSSRLIVNIDGSSWLYELTVNKKEILKKINEVLKGNKIKEITFRIGDTK